jgi:hypothetical protein
MWHNTQQDDIQFPPDIGRCFIGNALYRFDNSVSHPIYIFSFKINNIFLQTPEKKHPQKSNLENRGAENGPLSSYPVIRKFLSRQA